MTIHENQKALIAYNPHGHCGIILATPEGTMAWREVNNLGAVVDVHLFETEGMREQWGAWGEPALAVWEGIITEIVHGQHGEDGIDVEWCGAFRRATPADLIEFGLLLEDADAL